MTRALDDTDWAVRSTVYRALAHTGTLPDGDELAHVAGGLDALAERLGALHDHHQLVLDGDGVIRMALPFSAVPTEHVVRSGERSWFANCAWDALAIPAALGADAVIDAPWAGDGSPVDLRVVDGELVGDLDGVVHFVVPARRWWDDIVET